MNFVLWPRRCSSSINRHSKWLLLAAVVATASGCGREEIQVYNAPREPVKTVAHAQSPGRGMGLPPARPQVTWTLPKGWQESGAGQMSVASFSIKGEGSAEAQVTITPLTKLAGRDAEIVNMWREQVGLAALDREEALKQFEKVEVGGEAGNLFSIEGKPEGQSAPARIITAMVHREDASWFYKLSGDGVVVAAQKPAFLEFLKSIRLKEAPMAASTPAPADASAGSGAKPNWTVPAQWKELAAGQMQIARFAVPERGGAKAEVFVSVFPNDTGGTLANVNRWRRQLGLSELNESELGSIVTPLDPASPGAILVEMASSSQKFFGAVVPRNGSYWFYKLQGDTAVVAPQKDAFVAFAKSKP